MYMYVCIYVCIYICLYMRIYVCMYICMSVFMYVCMYMCMYVYMYVCMSSSASSHPDLAAVESASGETAMILAACHSLVVVEEDDVAEDRAANLVGRLGWCSYWCWCCMYVCLLDLFLYDQCSYEPD